MIKRRTILILFIAFNLNTVSAQVFEWVHHYGGTEGQGIDALVTDSLSNIYAVGGFQDTMIVFGSQDTFNLGGNNPNLFWETTNLFLSKTNGNGEIDWVKKWTHFGGNPFQTPLYSRSLAIDNQNNLIITGTFMDSIDFVTDTSIHTLGSQSQTYYDAFILKLNDNGNLLWVESLGGRFDDYGYCAAIDSEGDVYVLGEFKDTVDFDPGPNVFNLFSDVYSLFLLKLNSNGNFLWVKSFEHGPGGSNVSPKITIDAFDNVYVTSRFQNTADIDPNELGIVLVESNGASDIFITKLQADGSFIYGYSFGSEGNDNLNSIVTDSMGNVYIAGDFPSNADLDFGPDSAIVFVPGSSRDAYIAKYDSSGTYQWARTWGSYSGSTSNHVHARGLDVDSYGNVFVATDFKSPIDFDPGPGVSIVSPWITGLSEACISMFDANGNFSWVRHLGSTGAINPDDLVVAADGSIYTNGYISYGISDFDPSPDTVVIESSLNDGYLHKMSFCPPMYSSDSITVCGPYYSGNGIDSWNESGLYSNWLTSSSGCDSIITLDLTILSTESTVDTTLCTAFTSPSGLHVWSQSGTYFDTIPNSIGCDSIITVNLSLNYTDTTLGVTVCNGLVSPDGIEYWEISGTYTDTIPNSLGCDSVITVNLTILQDSYNQFDDVGCGSYTSPSGNYTWTQNGLFNDTLTNILGCDSVITLGLTIVNVDTSITQNGLSFMATASADSYQWLDCNNDMIPIPGETGQSFEPTENGIYAVHLIENGCMDTSACIAISSIGILENSFGGNVKVYPNPTSGHFSVELDRYYEDLIVEIFDLSGKLILSKAFKNHQRLNLELKAPAGVYLLQVQSEDKTAKVRIEKN